MAQLEIGAGEKNFRLIETQAQQSYRFYLSIEGVLAAYISNVTRPSYVISTQEYKLLNYYFHYPTDLKWQPVSFSIREVFSRDILNSVLGGFMDRLRKTVQDSPINIPENANVKSLTKRDLTKALGNVTIKSLDPNGDVYEEWKLYGAFITELKPSELNYSNTDLTKIDVTIRYDWAELIFKPR